MTNGRRELRRPEMAMLAGRALVDEGFRQILKNDPETAARDTGVELEEGEAEWIKGLPWDELAKHSRRIADNLPPIALVGDTFTWVSRGSVDDAAVVVQASDFDLARALVTRRSAAQLRSWTVRGDVTPYLYAFAMLGPLPTTDLTE